MLGNFDDLFQEQEEQMTAIEMMKSMSDEDLKIWKLAVGLEYEGDIPTLDELKPFELLSMAEDYSEYVQACYSNGKKPVTIQEFIPLSNLFFNAELFKLDTYQDDLPKVYILAQNNELEEREVDDTMLDEYGDITISCVGGDADDEFPAGIIYRTDKKWKE
jgi:hypothetical protein